MSIPESELPESRNIKTEGGGYNESIGNDYVRGNKTVNQFLSETKETHIQRFTLTIEGITFTDFINNPELQAKVSALLQEASKANKSSSFKFEDFRPGSVRVTLSGLPEEFERLRNAINSGELDESFKELGLSIKEFKEEIDTKEEEKIRLIQEIKLQEVIGRNLKGVDLSGGDLRGVYLIRANLNGANLNGADLSAADLSAADLSAVNLNSVILYRANLSRANLSGVDLSSANLRGAYLVEANLRSADLRGADLRGVDLSRANLRFANLRSADLSGTNINGTYLIDTNLSGTNLSGANLSGVDFSYISFRKLSLKLIIKLVVLYVCSIILIIIFSLYIDSNLEIYNIVIIIINIFFTFFFFKEKHNNSIKVIDKYFGNTVAENAVFIDNKGISKLLKRYLIKRGAIFK